MMDWMTRKSEVEGAVYGAGTGLYCLPGTVQLCGVTVVIQVRHTSWTVNRV